MIAIVSPHLDDAALSCWSLLPGAIVVNVFDGIPSATREPSHWDKICGFDNPSDLMRARLAEDEVALAKAGVIGVARVGALEAPHREETPPVEVFADAIRVEIEKWGKPDAILAPLAGGPKANPDHRIARDAALMVGAETRTTTALYADVPYCAKGGGWPVEWGGDHHVRWLGRVTRELRGRVLMVERVKRLSERDRNRKKRILDLYETQMRALDRGLREKGLISNRDVWGREVVLTLL